MATASTQLGSMGIDSCHRAVSPGFPHVVGIYDYPHLALRGRALPKRNVRMRKSQRRLESQTERLLET